MRSNFARRELAIARVRDSVQAMSDVPQTAPLFDRLGGRHQLATMLRRFYADVRQHQVIGPIFRAQIHDWPAHMEKIADFWSNATGGPILYAGPMPRKHFPLNLGPEHFAAWLDLWRRHCRIYFPKDEAEEMIVIAETIGERLHAMTAHYAAAAAARGGSA